MAKGIAVTLLICAAILGISCLAYAEPTIDNLLNQGYIVKVTLTNTQNRVKSLEEVQRATFNVAGYLKDVQVVAQSVTIDLEPGERLVDKLFNLHYEGGFLFYNKEINNLEGFGSGYGVRSYTQEFNEYGRLKQIIAVANIPSSTASETLKRTDFKYDFEKKIKSYTAEDSIVNPGGGSSTIVRLYKIDYHGSDKVKGFIYGYSREGLGSTPEQKYYVYDLMYDLNNDLVSCYIKKLQSY